MSGYAGEIMRRFLKFYRIGTMQSTFLSHCWRSIFFLTTAVFGILISDGSLAQPKKATSSPGSSLELKMVRSVMCDDVKDNKPVNEGLIFSSDLGKISCYTAFDPVPERTVVYHNWYFKDNLSTRRKLILNPPRWAAFSQIQVRETENGPWRVDIMDEDGRILQTLRFSVTD
jgi:hypothetical protein